MRIIAVIGSIDPAPLSEDEKRRLAWPKARQTDCLSDHDSGASKRQRSTELSAPRWPTRKYQPTKSRSPTQSRRPEPSKSSKHLSEVLKEGLAWAIIEKSHPDGLIDPTKWKLVEHALLDVFLMVMCSNLGPSPSFRDTGRFQVYIKLVAYSDLRFMDLYKAAFSRIGKVSPGARLTAVPPDQIPHSPRSRVRIPTGPSDPEPLLKILMVNNTYQPTSNRRVAKVADQFGDLWL